MRFPARFVPWPMLLAATLTLGCTSENELTGPQFAKGGSSTDLTATPATLTITWPLARPTFTVTTQFASIFTASAGSCVTVSPTTTTPVLNPQSSPRLSATFTVTPRAEGSCTVTVSDKKGNQVAVAISVQYPTMAFSTLRTVPGPVQIYTMKADGSQVTRVSAPGMYDIEPSWSPDGTRLAFTSRRDLTSNPNFPGFEIYTMLADGSNATRLTFTEEFEHNAIWTRDGSKILFTSNRANDRLQLYLMNPDGSDQVTILDAQAQQPAYSPDGSQLAFASNMDGHGLRIWIMNADGSGLHPITPEQDGSAYPAWSPDGTRIAFSSRRVGDGTLKIYVMNADGTGATQLTNGLVDESPSWTPDGSGIAYSGCCESTGSSEIWIMNPDGSGKTNISNNQHQDMEPVWKP
jgi:Tol biopolymer transport system component